ncbi:MAG: DUF11 domain-containing protein [Planctomycetota bacterium]|nr:DUF11 domain-containing protein [Planctomycetota bacterium]
MSRTISIRRRAVTSIRLAALAAAAAGFGVWGTRSACAQEGPATNVAAPGVATASDVPPAADAGAVGNAEPAQAALPAATQVVRFQVPTGVAVELVGPAAEALPGAPAAAPGVLVAGLKVGVGYRLRLSNLPDRPGAELWPVVEVVGHLHRPEGIDALKYPIRVTFSQLDIDEALDQGRLVTHVVYLEDPETALPISLPKTEIPTATVSAAEDPLRVAAALGRVMAIARIGARKPSADELAAAEHGLPVLWAAPADLWSGSRPCPFSTPGGARCGLPCGPCEGTAPPPGKPWMPKDEFLCDGGDHGRAAGFAGDGGLTGIDPRDAVVQFTFPDRKTRVLPTNTVCIYAPRCALVRASVGSIEALAVQGTTTERVAVRDVSHQIKQSTKRFTQNQAAEIDRGRARAAGTRSRSYVGATSDQRVAGAYENGANIRGYVETVGSEMSKGRQKLGGVNTRLRLDGIKTAEAAVLTGIVEGAGEAVMTWTPRVTVGVETPPDRPGLSVIKTVSASEAEPGDVVTYTIRYRNMGNTAIRGVSIVDSLLPRLGYVPGSTKGPKGTTFTMGENRVGSTELRWQIPGTVKAGTEGEVSFQATVR